MDHLGSDRYIVGDSLDRRNAAGTLGYSKAPSEKFRNREAMGGRRRRRLVGTSLTSADIFLKIRYFSTLHGNWSWLRAWFISDHGPARLGWNGRRVSLQGWQTETRSSHQEFA